MIVTTPAERRAKICAGWKPFPSSGFAATTGALSPEVGADWRTTTVVTEPPPSQPAALPTTSTKAPPAIAAATARAAAEFGRTGGHCSRAARRRRIRLKQRAAAFSRALIVRFERVSAEGEREERPAVLRVELDPAAHQLGQLARDCEPEARTGGAAAVQAVEALEDLLLRVAGDLGAVVCHRQGRATAVEGGRNPYRRPVGGVHERVLDQDPPDLEHPLGIGERRDRWLGYEEERAAGRRRPRGKLGRELGCKLRKVDRLLRHRQPPRVDAREVEEIGRELRQARHLLAHLREELVARRGVQGRVVEQ